MKVIFHTPRGVFETIEIEDTIEELEGWKTFVKKIHNGEYTRVSITSTTGDCSFSKQLLKDSVIVIQQ